MSSSERRLGKWTAGSRLGWGGNATVWEAKDDQGQVVALKVLRDNSGERLARFTDEIEVLKNISGEEGILPLIDFYLPEHSRQGPAWFTMPIASPIRDALGQEPNLEEVVVAITEVSRTLVRLQQRKIHHRDLKPSNLFRYEEKYCVGDFGLVDFPDKRELTQENRHLGPTHFIAPEMLNHPDTADPAPSDVFSLAKTLWVLATGQTYPPPGEMRTEYEQMLIGSYLPHPRVAVIDRLIERATRFLPERRPTMSEFRDELEAWSSPAPTEPDRISIDDLTARLKVLLEPSLKREGHLQVLEELGAKTLETFRASLAPIEEALKEADLIKQDVRPALAYIIRPHELKAPETHNDASRVWTRQECIRATPDVDPFPSRFSYIYLNICCGVTCQRRPKTDPFSPVEN